MVETVPIDLTYGEVEATLANLNRIADEKRVAFKARLKHFQRLGFPEGANTGTGKRVVYSVQMLFKLALATELTQAGMSPKRIVDILNHNWRVCEYSLLFASTPESMKHRWSPPGRDNRLVLILSPESLRDLSEEGEGEFDYYEAIDVCPVTELPEFLLKESETPIVGESYRHVMIELQPFVGRLFFSLMLARSDIEPEAMWADLELSVAADSERLEKLFAEFDVKLRRQSDGNS